MNKFVLLKRTIMSASFLAVLLSCTDVEAGRNKGKAEKRLRDEDNQTQQYDNPAKRMRIKQEPCHDEGELLCTAPGPMDVDTYESVVDDEGELLCTTSGPMDVDTYESVVDDEGEFLCTTSGPMDVDTYENVVDENEGQKRTGMPNTYTPISNMPILTSDEGSSITSRISIEQQLAEHSTNRASQGTDVLSLFDNISLMPVELQKQFVARMTLPELLEFNRSANDVIRGLLKTGPVLVEMVSEQLDQAIKCLFTLRENADGGFEVAWNPVGSKTFFVQLKSLVEVLMALHDHKYYRISEVVYAAMVERLKDSRILQRGFLQMRSNHPAVKIFELIIGQIFNHLDRKNRTFGLIFPESYQAWTPTFFHVLVELLLHKNNKLNKDDLAKLQRQLVQILLAEPAILTDETKARLRTIVENPRPELYHTPSALVGYVLKHPGQNTDIIKELVSDGKRDEILIVNAALNYLNEANVDLELMRVILQGVQHFQEYSKGIIYAAYLKSNHADPDVMECILEDTQSFCQSSKENIYAAYLKREDASSDIIARIIEYAQSIRYESHKADAYTVYVESTNRDNVITEILKDTQGFKAVNKVKVYIAYLKRTDAKPDVMECILKDTQSCQYAYHKDGIYVAYLRRADAKPDVVTRIIEDAQGFKSEPCRVKVYVAYLKRKDAKPDVMTRILDDAQSFRDDRKDKVLKAYKKRR